MRPVGNGRTVETARLAERVFSRRGVPTAAIIPDHRIPRAPNVAGLKTLLPRPFEDLLEQPLRRLILPSENADRVGRVDEERLPPALAVTLYDLSLIHI